VEKGWSIFFGLVLLASFLIWFVAPFFGWWLPENVSTYGGEVDFLFYIILWITGVFFVLTEVVLVYAMWNFTAKSGQRSEYTHGNHRLEMLWTAVPAAILLFIAFAQIPAWQSMKINAWDRVKRPAVSPAPHVVLTVHARQWEWRMRYPAKAERFWYDKDAGKDAIQEAQKEARRWADNPEADDIHLTNEVHTWKDADTKVYLRTQDVIHSFTIPNLRLKQDMLPGKTISVWFNPMRHNCRFDAASGKVIETGDKRDAWEIACQELCGGRHYAMRGRFFVHETKDSFDEWQRYTQKQQKARTPPTNVALGN